MNGYQWGSCRVAFCLRDALIHIILSGNRDDFHEIVNMPQSCNIDCLSLTASSYHLDGMRGVYFAHSILSFYAYKQLYRW